MGITECYEYDDLVRLNDYLLKMNFNYRELLNVSNDIPYTLDIDFMSFQPSDIKKSISNFNEKNKLIDKPFIISENSIFKKNDKNTCTVKSSLLNNKLKDNALLNDLFNTISNINGPISSNKCIHINVGLNELDKDNDNLLTLLKIYLLYEHIIYRFSYGDDLSSKVSMSLYSKELSNILYDFIRGNEITDDFYKNIDLLRKKVIKKEHAFNINKKSPVLKQDTMEFKMYNSNTNIFIIQNYINLVLNIIERIKNDDIDNSFLDYKLLDYDYNFYKTDNYKDSYYSDALEFCDLIFVDDIDKDYFLRQYFIKEKTKKLVI
ncbi:MAG: hypothetical protein IIZ40_01905 [Bacilli bacterium]|nr:hypothetical protein [Bacilli bacterium]